MRQLRQFHYVGLLGALSIAALTITVSVLLWGLRERELSHARLESVALAKMLISETDQGLDSVDLVLRAVQERLSNSFGSQFGLDSAVTQLLLASRASGLWQLGSIFLVDKRGILVNSSRLDAGMGLDLHDRAYFKAFIADPELRSFIEAPVRGRLDGRWAMYMARPLHFADGKLRGLVVAAMNLPEFEAKYRTRILDYERPISLLAADGRLLAGYPHRENMIGAIPPELHNEVLPRIPGAVRFVEHLSGDGERQTFALGRLEKYPFLITVTDDETLSLAPWREIAYPIGLGALLVGVFTAAVALYLIRKAEGREELADALRDATELYQHTVDSVMDAIVTIDAAHNVILFNPAAERMFDLKKEDVLGRSFEMLIPERVREGHQGYVAGFAVDSGGPRAMAPQLEISGRRRDGSEFPIESTISRSLIGGSLQMSAVLRDVTLHRRAEAGLRELNEQLRKLSASLQDVREQERTRIANELHDDLGQQLTGLKLSLSWLGTRLKEGRSATPDMVDEMRVMLDAAIASVKRLASELRPLILDDLGFAEAIAFQSREFAKHSHLEMVLNLTAAPLVSGDANQTALFRIVQESLNNIVRHAAATAVHIDLIEEGDALVLRVSDNGKGVAAGVRQGGIGLVSMRERAIAIGARFEIISQTGKGTTVQVTVPLDVLDNPEDMA